MLDYITRHYGKLKDTSTEKQKELLEKIMDYRIEFECLAEAVAFEYGFKRGAKMILEVIKEVAICGIRSITLFSLNR